MVESPPPTGTANSRRLPHDGLDGRPDRRRSLARRAVCRRLRYRRRKCALPGSGPRAVATGCEAANPYSKDRRRKRRDPRRDRHQRTRPRSERARQLALEDPRLFRPDPAEGRIPSPAQRPKVVRAQQPRLWVVGVSFSARPRFDRAGQRRQFVDCAVPRPGRGRTSSHPQPTVAQLPEWHAGCLWHRSRRRPRTCSIGAPSEEA